MNTKESAVGNTGGRYGTKEELLVQLNQNLHRMMALNHAIRQTQRNHAMGAVDFLIKVRNVRSPCNDMFQPRLVEQLNSVLTECAERCSRLILEQQLCVRLELEAEIRRLSNALLTAGMHPGEIHFLTCKVMEGQRNWHTECLAFGYFRKPVEYYLDPVGNPNGIKANKDSTLHMPRPLYNPN